jgi:hypothetical protein
MRGGVAKVRAGGNRFGVRRLAAAFAGPACWPALGFNLDWGKALWPFRVN